MVGLFVCHCRMAGQAQFLSVDALGDRQREFVPYRVAGLLVRRYRIVYFRLHAVVGQILFQFIATRRKDWEDMTDAVTLTWRNYDVWMFHLIYIYRSYLAAAGVVGIQVTQFDVKDGSLQFVDARVAALVVEDVLAGRTVIAEGTNHGGQVVVIGSHSTGIAEGTEVFGRIEGVTSGMAEGAGERLCLVS